MDGGRAAARRVNHAMPRLVNQNRLVKVTKDNGDVIAFDYDYLSRRIKKSSTINNQLSTINYLYDGWNCIAEYTGTTLSKTYLWGMDISGSMQGAGGVGGLLAVKQGGIYFYPTYDGNGNVTEYLESDEDIAAHFEYDPFGNLTVDTNSNAESFPYRFSTKPQDGETGLYYYTYRYYDPVTGRWLSRDPIEEEGGLNLCGYVENDPIDNFDYLGNKPGESGRAFRGRGFRLSFDSEEPNVGNCGMHSWLVKFKVDRMPKFGGIIAQNIEYKTWDITDCKTGKKHEKRSGFFELIGMAAGSTVSDDDEWGFSEQKCTKGKIKIVGKAKFYENRVGGSALFDRVFANSFARDPDFTQNSVGPIDRNRRFFPGGARSNQLTRTLTAEWDCCAGKSETKLTVK